MKIYKVEIFMKKINKKFKKRKNEKKRNAQNS